MEPGSDKAQLALRPREAARALSISERTLWAWTEEGIVPCVRIGGTKLYSVDVLRERLRLLSDAPANGLNEGVTGDNGP